MNVANCQRCNRMFQRTPGRKICQDCLVLEEEALVQVRDYVENHPGCNRDEVLAALEIDEGILSRLLKDGRLAVLGDAAVGLSVACRNCGSPMVSGGEFCKGCAEELGRALQASARGVASAPKRSVVGRAPEDRSLALVLDYLRRHPGALVADVEKGTGVPAAAVLLFLGEGRLSELGTATSGLRGR